MCMCCVSVCMHVPPIAFGALFDLEVDSISMSNHNLIGLFSTEGQNRDLED